MKNKATQILWITLFLGGPALLAQDETRVRHQTTALAFAESLSARDEACDLSAYDRAVDIESLVGKALRGIDLTPGFLRGIVEGATQSMNLGGQICTSIKRSGGSFKLLHLRPQSGRFRAMFRIIYGSGGFNYHDLLLHVEEAGKVVIEDVFLFSSGEWLSATLRRGFLPAIAELGEVDQAGLDGQESEYLKALEQVRQAAELFQQGETKKALEVHDSLPRAVRSTRNMMLQRLFIASELSEEEDGDQLYRQALMDISESFPNDPALDILMIDRYVFAEDYSKVLELVDRVDLAVGGDPYLDLLRANMNVAMGDPAAARQHAQRLIQAEPDLEDPYWIMLSLCLEAQDWAGAANWLTRLEADLGVELNDLKGVSGFEGFVETEVYRQWLKRDPPPASPTL